MTALDEAFRSRPLTYAEIIEAEAQELIDRAHGLQRAAESGRVAMNV